MCGIVGYWRLGGLESSAQANLSAMMDLLVHRGPDGRGHHLDPARGLAMGHTRLRINDLSGGEQPLRSADGRTILTANNQFYDFKSIRAQLSCLGERFVSKSDAELALALYHRHGLDFVEHLRGEFAFALYDTREDQLLLVRDRFGVKPLYVHQTDDAIYWASEIKALLRHPQVPRRLEPRAVLHQMMQIMVPGMTAFAEIEAVQPGHMLVLRRRGDRLEREQRVYWDLDFPLTTERSGHAGPREWIDGVRERLIDAVEVRLDADVPVGCYLSGGLDSCSILGIASAVQQSPITAYTIGFDHPAYDESSLAAEVARANGARHELLRLRAQDLHGDAFARVVWHTERTFYNTLAVAKWHMSRRVRERGGKSVLTGEGSDELFAGYAFFKRDLFVHAGEPSLRDRLGSYYASANEAEQRAEHPAWNELIGFTPAWLQPWIVTLELARPLLSATLREQLADYDPLAAIAAKLDRRQLAGRHVLDRLQYSWIKTMLEGQILSWGGDRVDMANSVESRPAFLDHRLAELARMIPPEYRICDGIEKWALREAMRGVLPRSIYEREKFAFLAPPSGPLDRAAIERHASREALLETGLFDPDRVAAFFSSGRAGDDNWAHAIRHEILCNHILGLQILHRDFVQQSAADAA
jgi:asparagine synthase (glutamine-hydrolysing)